MKVKPKEEIEKLLFITSFEYSHLQILAVLVFGPAIVGATCAMIFQLVALHNTELSKIAVTIALIFVGIYGLKSFIIDTIISWFTVYYTVELFEDRVVGYNLWGKKTELRFENIVRVENHKDFVSRGAYSTSFIDNNGHVHGIIGNIDYSGFIHDYIIRRIKSEVVDTAWVIKMRQRYRMWSYTRRSPFDTKYDPKYLDWLYEQVVKQKEELVGEGILKPNVWYGDVYSDKLGKKIDK